NGTETAGLSMKKRKLKLSVNSLKI
ncbi:hypothetical protein BVZ38_01430B, partial [Haemophilus influenzae]